MQVSANLFYPKVWQNEKPSGLDGFKEADLFILMVLYVYLHIQCKKTTHLKDLGFSILPY